MKNDPSEVLALYLGAGPAGGYQPAGGEDRLRAAFPRDFRSVRSSLDKYLELPDYPPHEWTSNDLAKEQTIYEQRLAHKFPELDARAINALACCWSYGWR